MSIEKLAVDLQKLIDEKMNAFSFLGKKAKEQAKRLEKTHQEMSAILHELKPVESLIKAQHPEKAELFDALLGYKDEK